MRIRDCFPAIIFFVTLIGSLPAQPSQSVVEGDIDVPKALKALFGNYDPETQVSHWNDPRAEKATEKAIDGEALIWEWATQEGLVDGKRQWFLYTLASPANGQNTCHACQLVFGAAMFQKEDRGWVVMANHPALIGVGSFGDMPMDPKPVQWGKQGFGLVVTDSYVGNGEETTQETLYTCKTTGECRIVFSIPTGYNNALSLAPAAEMISWSAEWSFAQPGPTGMFDIVLKVSGDVQRSRTLQARKRGQGSPTAGTFRYDGKTYRQIATRVELGK